MALISVIMSVHNGEKTLKRAIDSILRQTIQDFEFIICDDTSTDNSYKILKEYEDKDSRFIIIRNETNLGLAASLNKCLEKASGEYIARMDDDDISLPERFEKQIDFLAVNNQYAFVSSNSIVFDGNGDIRIGIKPEVPDKNDFIKGSPYLHPAVMFRRDAILSIGGYSTKEYTKKRAQDYELFMRMASRGLNGYNIQQPLLKYYYSQKVTQRKRSIKSMVDEIKIRYYGYKQLGVKPWQYIFIFIPVYVYIKHLLISNFSRK